MFNLDNFKNQKNTTVWGIGVVLSAIAAILVAQFDGNAATNTEWAAAVAAVLGGVKLMFGAKDAD